MNTTFFVIVTLLVAVYGMMMFFFYKAKTKGNHKTTSVNKDEEVN